MSPFAPTQRPCGGSADGFDLGCSVFQAVRALMQKGSLGCPLRALDSAWCNTDGRLVKTEPQHRASAPGRQRQTRFKSHLCSLPISCVLFIFVSLGDIIHFHLQDKANEFTEQSTIPEGSRMVLSAQCPIEGCLLSQ